jgi:hypothetical protein
LDFLREPWQEGLGGRCSGRFAGSRIQSHFPMVPKIRAGGFCHGGRFARFALGLKGLQQDEVAIEHALETLLVRAEGFDRFSLHSVEAASFFGGLGFGAGGFEGVGLVGRDLDRRRHVEKTLSGQQGACPIPLWHGGVGLEGGGVAGEGDRGEISRERLTGQSRIWAFISRVSPKGFTPISAFISVNQRPIIA